MGKGIVVIGAGGHAKVCIEILRAMGQRVAYCVGGEDSYDHCLDIPVLKGDEHIGLLRSEGHDVVFVAIGSNKLRRRLAARALELGYRLISAISPDATVSPSTTIGAGVVIMAGAVVNAQSTIGDLAIINTGSTVDHDCRIGPGAHIAPQSALAGNVTVGENSFLGIGCKVVPEISIGRDVTLGAGSVVISDIPAYITAVGVPAKIIKRHST